MQRLLERVRGDEIPAGAQESQLGGSSSSEGLESSNSADPPEPTVLTASEYQPRSQAPEMNANLAAMRAIANDSRHTNMRTHAQRKWTDQSQTKFIGSIAGL